MPAVRRRLIVACDGTWQSSTSGERNIPSNVTRLCRHLARSQVVDEFNKDTGKTESVLYNQMVFYDPGIGTGDITNADTNRQGGTGAGLATNVIEAYNWLVLNYQPGDKIYCFGFSRGAYTARSLAGFIADMGICAPLDMIFFPYIYDLYEGAVTPESKNKYEEAKKLWQSGTAMSIPFRKNDKDENLFLNTGPRPPIDPETRKVEVVGVWDTVGSLGIPKIGGWLKLPSWLDFLGLDKPGREFHDVKISDNVRHAFHALALDERRLPFAPTLWYVPHGVTRAPELSLKQVWFPGVHINAGGGSDDVLKNRKADCEQLANVTFAWMVQQCRPFLAFNEQVISKQLDNQQRLLAKMSGKDYRMTTAKKGWADGKIIDSYSDAGITIKLGGSQWRSPGETMQPISSVDKEPVRTIELGETNEEIHASVFYRMQQLKQRNPSLEHFKRRVAKDGKGWEWFKPSKNKKGENIEIIIPESRILPHDAEESKPRNIERLVIESNGVQEYLSILDDMWDNGVDKTPADSGYTKLAV